MIDQRVVLIFEQVGGIISVDNNWDVRSESRKTLSTYNLRFIGFEYLEETLNMNDGQRLGFAKRTIIGAIIGAIPGGIIVLLTVPVSGEAELSLGVGGIFLAIIGIAIGAIVGARKK